jgi:hypothetical protein
MKRFIAMCGVVVFACFELAALWLLLWVLTTWCGMPGTGEPERCCATVILLAALCGALWVVDVLVRRVH